MAMNLAVCSVRLSRKDILGEDSNAIYQPRMYKLAPAHQKLYEQLVEEQLLLLPDSTKIDATNASKLHHACQQILLNWSVFGGEDKRPAGYDLLDNVIEEVGDKKLIVWTNYQMTSKAVTAYLSKIGKTAAAYGAVDSKAGVDSFMNDPETQFLVAQPTSVGYGLEAQHVCSDALFLEFNTVPIHNKQAAARVDRQGQKGIAHIRYAVAQKTIQVKLLNDLLNNDDMASKVELTKKSLRDVLLGVN